MNVFAKIAAAICSLWFIGALLCCNYSFNIGVLFGVMTLWIVAGFLVGRKELARFPLWLFFVSLSFYLFVIVVIQSPQVSDFLFLVDSARDFIGGNSGAFHTLYVDDWPDLCAAGVINVIMLSIVNKVTFIKVCQAVASSAMCVLAYLILCEMTTRKCAQVGSVLLAFFPLFAFSIEMANNQVLSALFCMGALYLFVRYARQYNTLSTGWTIALACLMGILVAIARFVRPDALLVVIALAFSLLVIAFDAREKTKKSKFAQMLRSFVPAISTVAVYVLVTSLLSFSLHAMGVASENQRGENVALNKILMGTNLDTSGGWSADYQDLNARRAQEEGTSYQEAAIRTIAERVIDPGYVANLAVKKLQRLWWTNSEVFNLNHLDESIQAYIAAIEKSCVLLLIIFNLILFARLWRSRCLLAEVKCLLPFIGILALTACAYSFIEVQPRYLYFAYIVMFILATVVIYEVIQPMKKALAGYL